MWEVAEGGSICQVGGHFGGWGSLKYVWVIVAQGLGGNLGEGIQVSVAVHVNNVVAERGVDVIEDAGGLAHVRWKFA